MIDKEYLKSVISCMKSNGYFKVTFNEEKREFILAHEIFEGKPFRIYITLEDEDEIANIDKGLMSFVGGLGSTEKHIKSYVDLYFGYTPVPSYTGLVKGVEEMEQVILMTVVPCLQTIKRNYRREAYEPAYCPNDDVTVMFKRVYQGGILSFASVVGWHTGKPNAEMDASCILQN